MIKKTVLKFNLLLLLCWCVTCASASAAEVELVVFDFGGVVANVDKKEVVYFVQENLKLPSYEKAKELLRKEHKIEKQGGDVAGFWQQQGATSGKEWQKKLADFRLSSIHEISGIREVIQGVKKEGIELALLSNISKREAKLVQIRGFFDLFDDLFLSCAMGMEKPNRKVFSFLLQETGVLAENCLFIDDKRENVEAAKAMGIDAILFTSPAQLKAELDKRLTK